MAIIIDDKEYRNLQEQVGYLTEELTRLKQIFGEALPDPIPGPPGDPGERGETGPQGRTPNIGFGYGPLPTEGYENGDLYIARGSTNGLTKGNVYLRVNNTWQLQLNLVGPQGPEGSEGEDVIANPAGAYSESLEKVDIDGTIYDVLTSTVRSWLYDLDINNFYYDDVNNYYYFGKLIYAYSGIKVSDSDLEIDNNGAAIKLKSGLNQIVDNDNNPIVICENFKDENGNARFVEGNLTTENTSGTTYVYAKYSLSGSHLLIVLAGTIPANSGQSNIYMASCNSLPQYIYDKIIPVWADEFVCGVKTNFIDDSWNETERTVYLGKNASGIYIYAGGNYNFNSNRHFRVQFDLLIDME